MDGVKTVNAHRDGLSFWDSRLPFWCGVFARLNFTGQKSERVDSHSEFKVNDPACFIFF
jgi:hypothetical protein